MHESSRCLPIVLLKAKTGQAFWRVTSLRLSACQNTHGYFQNSRKGLKRPCRRAIQREFSYERGCKPKSSPCGDAEGSYFSLTSSLIGKLTTQDAQIPVCARCAGTQQKMLPSMLATGKLAGSRHSDTYFVWKSDLAIMRSLRNAMLDGAQ